MCHIKTLLELLEINILLTIQTRRVTRTESIKLGQKTETIQKGISFFIILEGPLFY